MPPPLRDPSQLGVVVNYQGQYRAEIYLKGSTHIRGPRRGDSKKRAFEDLLAIRAAASGETTRMGAIQAMRREADRLKPKKATEAGGVEPFQNGFRARIRVSKDGLSTIYK
jgi:hypothetical protein